MTDDARRAVRGEIGARIRRRRKLMGLTLVELAEQVGCRMQQIQKYETGANEVGATRLYQLAEALDVNVQYFFETLQNNHAEDDSALNEAGLIKAARAIAQLPVHVRDRFTNLALSAVFDNDDVSRRQ